MAIYMWRERVPPTESIIYKMNVDSSGNLYVPTWWRNASGSFASPYNWKVSVDYWEEETYSWTWSLWSKITLSWYTAWTNHTIIILPTTEDYQWARAFSFEGNSTIAPLLTEIVHDETYMWYAISSTSVWDSFRYAQYNWCTSLVSAPNEYLPDTLTYIWSSFRQSQYSWCTSLIAAPEEVFPDAVTTAYTSFRAAQYRNCTALTEIKWWKDKTVTTHWSNYRSNQFNWCTANKTVKVLSSVILSYISSNSLYNDYVTTISVPSAALNNYKTTNYYPRANITDSKFIWY